MVLHINPYILLVLLHLIVVLLACTLNSYYTKQASGLFGRLYTYVYK